MQMRPIQLTDVTYNAANQRFEALVIVHDNDTSHRYACAINAPISMSYADAATGLTAQALRRHKAKAGTYSKLHRHVPAQRAGRRGMDALRWLESLVHRPRSRAA